jgi:dienelactone hydrolase
VYAGAYHGFDAPGGRVVHRLDVSNGVVPGAGVHVGPDPAARADANDRVEAFLRATIGGD